MATPAQQTPATPDEDLMNTYNRLLTFLEHAQGKGAFNLTEAATIYQLSGKLKEYYMELVIKE